MREVVSRCDICGGDGPAVTYTVRDGEREIEVELCELHAKPLRKIMAAGRPVAHKPGTSPRAGIRSLEERIRGIPAATEDS